ncbi:rRNA adenine N-6-methyltransferase family protein [Marinobacter sp. SS13-12]|uniref:class I SAM-dependent methyltransferase n=1 Tax=Marinobacter sp. SS13-12 TaxID=3050451 RepID=UPI0025551385|nr:rRNA adenine N-6-methyltransferase family protein [Marinobacter sp. SS13-12]MDK8463517.1 rRNA adenine N-6-methyltransferase family protein [Marinobacter sp. SS13-12]
MAEGEESGSPKYNSNRRTSPAAFLLGFLREPRQVGSVIPSSRFLEQRIVEASNLSAARRVVELGPGTGGTTRTFLRHLGQDAKLLSIELSPYFHELLDEIADPRFTNHLGSAEDIADILALHDMGQPDVVISGIPFSKMPEAVATRVAQAVRDNLAEGGRFIAYQFCRDVAWITGPIMGAPASCRLELRNIPPMRVYSWFKTADD